MFPLSKGTEKASPLHISATRETSMDLKLRYSEKRGGFGWGELTFHKHLLNEQDLKMLGV